MSPKYKLTYFNVMALAEPPRLLFAHAGVEYEDVRVEREDWPALKPHAPWGSMPILEVDGKQLCQSAAIVRYLGRKFNLAPADEFQTAKCDEYMDAITDLRLEATGIFREEDAVKKAEKQKKLKEESMPASFKRFDDILRKNGTGFLVSNSLTYSDIFVAHFVQFLSKHSEFDLQPYSALVAHQTKIFNLPGIKAWVAKRPVTQF